MNEFTKALVVLALVCLAIPTMGCYYGWAGATLWGWFVVPMGAPAVSTFQMAGISLLINLLKPNSHRRQTKEEIEHSLWMLFMFPGLTLAVGYMFHKWM